MNEYAIVIWEKMSEEIRKRQGREGMLALCLQVCICIMKNVKSAHSKQIKRIKTKVPPNMSKIVAQCVTENVGNQRGGSQHSNIYYKSKSVWCLNDTARKIQEQL